MERKRLQGLREDFLDGLGVPEEQPFRPDKFQLDAIEALKREEDVLVIAPTGAGKTYIAVEGIRAIIAQKKRAVYTAPLKALSNAKYAEFKKKFEPEFSVGLLTGDRKIDGDADIVIATTEIYRNELYSFRDNYSLVVLDELHYLADPQRGSVWEESIILSPSTSTLLMLSASISNAREVSDWIEDTRGKKVTIISVTHRPVELRWGFMHPELGVMPLEENPGEVIPEVSRFYSTDHSPRHELEFRGRKKRRKRGFR